MFPGASKGLLEQWRTVIGTMADSYWNNHVFIGTMADGLLEQPRMKFLTAVSPLSIIASDLLTIFIGTTTDEINGTFTDIATFGLLEHLRTPYL